MTSLARQLAVGADVYFASIAVTCSPQMRVVVASWCLHMACTRSRAPRRACSQETRFYDRFLPQIQRHPRDSIHTVHCTGHCVSESALSRSRDIYSMGLSSKSSTSESLRLIFGITIASTTCRRVASSAKSDACICLPTTYGLKDRLPAMT